MIFSAMLLTNAQTTPPDHYWDFSKVQNVNGYNYVFDQVTQDFKYAFGKIPDRSGTCDVVPSTTPTYGPEGTIFQNYTNYMRLENGNNVLMGSKWMIAVWVKVTIPSSYSFNNYDIISQRRYDNNYSPLYSLGIGNLQHSLYCLQIDNMPNQTDAQFTFTSRINSYTQPYYYYSADVRRRTNTTLTDGWYLVSIAVDTTSQVYNYTSRIRQANGLYDNHNDIQYSGYIYNESLYTNEKTDIYVGGYCQPYYTEPIYAGAYPITLGRLYIWKNYANLMQHNFFDRFFFRQGGSLTLTKFVMPTCVGDIPCGICVVGYPVPTTYNANLTCSSHNSDKSKYLFADWQFDDPTNTQTSQFIQDKSGNRRHLMKVPTNQVGPNELFRIVGQGSMFYGNMIYAQGTYLFPFYKKPQFTIEVWYRKVFDNAPATSQPKNTIIPIQISSKDYLQNYFMWILSEDNLRSSICLESNCGRWANQSLPNTYMKDDKWHFAAIGFSSIRMRYNYYVTSMRLTADTYTSLQRFSSSYEPFPIPTDAVFSVGAFKTVIIRSLKIFNYVKHADEAVLQYNTGTNCQIIGNQSQCAICPIDGQCQSNCNENEYGANCNKCHIFCGHCTGPLKSDCVYCARNVTPANVFFSTTFGNCSCISGMYYNSTTDKCESCDPLCQDCYGPTNSMCMTCKTGKVFYPNSICANNCNDPAVVQGTGLGFYQTLETLNGISTKTCSKCHQYCTQCNGTLNTQCQACQPGYFLINGNTCYSTCPTGYFPDNTTRICSACHGDCQTCSGPQQSQCLTCKNVAKYQQGGTCQVACNNGYFPDTSKACQICNPACSTCTSQPATDCQSCSNGYFLEWLGKSCQNTCKNGTYGDNNTNTCQLCHYSCETCTGGNTDQCKKCAAGYLVRGKFCVTQCSENEFQVNGTCVSCDSKCTTCYGTRNDQCYTCAENQVSGVGYFYFNDSCLDTCPAGYYPDNLRRICRKCNPRCATCLSDFFCTSCVYGPYQLNNGECTYFTCLDTQYRTIKPQLACYECDSSCQTCQGQSKFDCLSCKPQNQFQAQQCLSCTQQAGMTDPIDDTPGCVEICGDGFNYGSFQCDDGNLNSGDGCSSKCIIEEGFNCTSGSKLAPSVCMDNKNPTPKISLITSKNYIIIQFDEEVQLQQTLDETTILISVTGPQSSYKFDWRLGDDYKNSEPTQLIIIELSFYSTLKGDSKEQVQVQFLSNSVYKDPTGNGIITVPLFAYLNKYDYIDPDTKAKLDAAGDTSMLATFGAVAINLVISQLFGGSIAAMWTMVNTIQLISLLPLCNVNYPTITVMVLEKMLSSHGESTIIPNVFYTYLINRKGSTVKIEPALNERFSDYGYTISNFLFLSGRKILLWTFIIIAYPFVWYMKQKYADKHKLCRPWINIEQKFRYTLLLRGVIMSYVSMYLAFILGIFQMDLTTMENTISAFFAIAFGLILTYLPILLMGILQRNYDKIHSEKFMNSYSTVVKEVDLSHPIRYMYYPVFLMRRALFAISLVLFANSPVLQIGFMTVTAFVMIIYVVVVKPQKEKVMIILTALGEAVLVILHLFSLVFLDDELPEEKANTYGYLFLVIIGLYVISNWIVILTITIKQLKQKWKNFKSSKIDAKQKLEDDREYRLWKKTRYIKYKLEKEQKNQKVIDQLEEKVQRQQDQRKSDEELKENDKMQNTNFENFNNNNNYLQLPYYQDLTQSHQSQYGYTPYIDLNQVSQDNNDGDEDLHSLDQVDNVSQQQCETPRSIFVNTQKLLSPSGNKSEQPNSPNIFQDTNSKLLYSSIKQQERANMHRTLNEVGRYKSQFAKKDENRYQELDATIKNKPQIHSNIIDSQHEDLLLQSLQSSNPLKSKQFSDNNDKTSKNSDEKLIKNSPVHLEDEQDFENV